MTKTLILIALIVLIYLYWKSQQKPKLNPNSETLYETEFPDLELKDFSQEPAN